MCERAARTGDQREALAALIRARSLFDAYKDKLYAAGIVPSPDEIRSWQGLRWSADRADAVWPVLFRQDEAGVLHINRNEPMLEGMAVDKLCVPPAARLAIDMANVDVACELLSITDDARSFVLRLSVWNRESPIPELPNGMASRSSVRKIRNGSLFDVNRALSGICASGDRSSPMESMSCLWIEDVSFEVSDPGTIRYECLCSVSAEQIYSLIPPSALGWKQADARLYERTILQSFVDVLAATAERARAAIEERPKTKRNRPIDCCADVISAIIATNAAITYGCKPYFDPYDVPAPLPPAHMPSAPAGTLGKRAGCASPAAGCRDVSADPDPAPATPSDPVPVDPPPPDPPAADPDISVEDAIAGLLAAVDVLEGGGPA